MKYSFMKKTGFLSLMFVITFASCVPQKKMLYLKEAEMISEAQSK